MKNAGRGKHRELKPGEQMTKMMVMIERLEMLDKDEVSDE